MIIRFSVHCFRSSLGLNTRIPREETLQQHNRFCTFLCFSHSTVHRPRICLTALKVSWSVTSPWLHYTLRVYALDSCIVSSQFLLRIFKNGRQSKSRAGRNGFFAMETLVDRFERKLFFERDVSCYQRTTLQNDFRPLNFIRETITSPEGTHLVLLSPSTLSRWSSPRQIRQTFSVWCRSVGNLICI